MLVYQLLTPFQMANKSPHFVDFLKSFTLFRLFFALPPSNIIHCPVVFPSATVKHSTLSALLILSNILLTVRPGRRQTFAYNLKSFTLILTFTPLKMLTINNFWKRQFARSCFEFLKHYTLSILYIARGFFLRRATRYTREGRPAGQCFLVRGSGGARRGGHPYTNGSTTILLQTTLKLVKPWTTP